MCYGHVPVFNHCFKTFFCAIRMWDIMNIGTFRLRMRENRSVQRVCEFCHGFYEIYGLNFCSISQNSC